MTESNLTLDVTLGERFLLSKLMSANTRCQKCKSGPVDTTEPLKLIRFGKLWDVFGLAEFEEIDSTVLQKRLAENESDKTSVTLTPELLRFIIEIILQQAPILFNFGSVVRLLTMLITLAKENNVKINSDNTDKKSIDKQVAFSNKEMDAILVTFLTSKKCDAEFKTTEGQIVPHGQATDYPRTVDEFITYTRLISQLNIKNILSGTDRFIPFVGEQYYSLDETTLDYLEDFVAKRSTITPYPPTKFIAIINKIEEAKNKNETSN